MHHSSICVSDGSLDNSVSNAKAFIAADLPCDLSFGAKAASVAPDQARTIEGAKIAVVAHVFYEDVWPELLLSLRRMPIDFDLYATVPKDHALSLGGIIRRSFPRAQIIPSENRGRDIGPFFKAVLHAERSADYTAICKIHTKKGTTHPDVWRHLLLDSVLGSSALILEIVRGFINHPRLALVGSQDLYFSGPKFVAENKQSLKRIAMALYGGRELPREWGFVAGTMFWFRPKTFASLTRFIAETVMFEADSGQNDGQIAHGLERAFGLIPAMSDCDIGLVMRSSTRSGLYTLTIHRAPGVQNMEAPAKYLHRMSKQLNLSLRFE